METGGSLSQTTGGVRLHLRTQAITTGGDLLLTAMDGAPQLATTGGDLSRTITMDGAHLITMGTTAATITTI